MMRFSVSVNPLGLVAWMFMVISSSAPLPASRSMTSSMMLLTTRTYRSELMTTEPV